MHTKASRKKSWISRQTMGEVRRLWWDGGHRMEEVALELPADEWEAAVWVCNLSDANSSITAWGGVHELKAAHRRISLPQLGRPDVTSFTQRRQQQQRWCRRLDTVQGPLLITVKRNARPSLPPNAASCQLMGSHGFFRWISAAAE